MFISQLSDSNDFELSKGVSPLTNSVRLKEGYRSGEYRIKREDGGMTRIPMIVAAATREEVYGLFIALLEPLGDEVDTTVQSRHAGELRADKKDTKYCGHIDTIVLLSRLWDFEDVLVDDGLMNISIRKQPHDPAYLPQVQLDYDKRIRIYSADLRPFKQILHIHGLQKDCRMQFVTNGAREHRTTENFAKRFHDLTDALTGYDYEEGEGCEDEEDDSFSCA